MKITDNKEFINIASDKLIEWHRNKFNTKLTRDNIYLVWNCKTLQNFKCILSTDVKEDGVIAEFTYDGDRERIYGDFYIKDQNICYN